MTPRQQMTHGAFAHAAEELTHQIQGEEIAREAVWPVHEGRNNTIRSYFGDYSGTSKFSFVMPADKKFIITDVSFNLAGQVVAGAAYTSCMIQYVEGAVTTVIYSAMKYEQSNLSLGEGHRDSFRAGIPVPAGATLQFGNGAGQNHSRTTCVVAGLRSRTRLDPPVNCLARALMKAQYFLGLLPTRHH